MLTHSRIAPNQWFYKNWLTTTSRVELNSADAEDGIFQENKVNIMDAAELPPLAPFTNMV